MSNSYGLTYILLTLSAYFLGGLPFGYWFVRLSLGKDIRTMGSGNIGATNVHRTAGGKAGVIVLILDILKGVLAVALAYAVTGGDSLALALAASAVVVGHCYPALLGFRGGKAVACFVGAYSVLAPIPLLGTAAVFFLAVVTTRYISLGAILGAITFPFLLWWINHPPMPLLYSSIFTCTLIVYRHRANIMRLRTGTENAFSLHKKSL